MVAKITHSSWLFWGLVVLAGSGYGVTLYALFDSVFFHSDNSGGVMMASFLFGVPFSTSALINYFLISQKRGGFFKWLGSMVAVGVAVCVFSSFFFHEGTICIALLLGCILVPTILGAVLGWIIGGMKLKQKPTTLMSVFAVLPLLMGGVESHFDPQTAIYDVERSVFIAAPAETVWANILYAPAIQPEEVAQGIAYKIGSPHPVEAKVTELKIGGIRKSVWERGVTFDEEITGFEVKRFIEWKYHFNDKSFPPGSMDEHVRIGGKYFDLKDTRYTLRPVDGGTYLDISVKYRVTTDFNWYAEPLAVLFVADTADTLLNLYKKRSENGRGTVGH